MYQVLARKWRPQTFDALIGQQHVARTLRNAIESQRLAHAYVFAGVRGTGKTTVARLLAKGLNCEKGPTGTPCNVCPACLEIADSRSLDVIELDAATRTQVDNIRELQEILSHGPVRDRYKVLILDEAHMLSRHSSNALLKTIEEPPPRVVFVLATTEAQKLLPTILSRCQLFEFRRLTVRDIAAHLRRVCDEESVTVSDDVIERVARAGEGSVRDALSVLERLIACCGSTIADQEALTVLGAVRTETWVELVSALGRRDAAAMLGVLDAAVDGGHDLVHLWGEMLGVVRDLMLRRTLGPAAVAERGAEEMERIAAAAEGLGREDLSRVFQVLADLEPGLKGSSQPRFLFEAALIRMADLGAVRPIETVLAQLEGRTQAPAAAEPRRAAPADPKKKVEAVAESPGRGAAAGTVDGFREAVRRERPMLDAILDQAGALRLAADGPEIAFPAEVSHLRRQLERPDYVEVLERAAAETYGRPARVRIVFEAATPAAAPRPTESPVPDSPAVARVPVPPPAPAAGRGNGGSNGAQRASLIERAREEPGVRKLLFEFGAHVVDIRSLAPGSEEATAEERVEDALQEEQP